MQYRIVTRISFLNSLQIVELLNFCRLIIFRFREKICITMPYYVSTSITLDAEDEELATPSAARLLLYSYVQRNKYSFLDVKDNTTQYLESVDTSDAEDEECHQRHIAFTFHTFIQNAQMPSIISKDRLRHQLSFYLVPFALRYVISHLVLNIASQTSVSIEFAPDCSWIVQFLSLWTPCLVMFTSGCSKCGITNIRNITLPSSEFDVSSDGPLS
ncbi:hypothetical protein T03_16391 [Trichinella britovi]|uniref:Uncharacterized protein n=1 Tax=Trichinella britovi TaxID=45882 RepID=A0A0V1CEF2_TRIBR|nr:hypothetical protein T03_16391 [Trichinella britovi]